MRKSALVLTAVLLSTAVSAPAQEAGVKQVEQLTNKFGSTVEAITDARAQLVKTMDVYNSIFSEVAKDRKSLYKKLQNEMDTMVKRRGEISTRAEQTRIEADNLFVSWGNSLSGITDPDLRKRSEERLAKTKARYADIQATGRQADDAYAPVMKKLQDQVAYLGHDLNAEAVGSLKGDAAKLTGQVDELKKRIDDLVGSINKNIDALRPQ